MTSPSSSSRDLSDEIDRLLETYLSLLDQYTTLRAQLSAQQISTQQNLARAKFHAPLGVHYGESMYDGRMQAQRRCVCRETTTLDIVAVESAACSEEGDTTSAGNENGVQEKIARRDPIRMFGLLVPEALRRAHGDAVVMVERIVPEICRVDREMGELEIRIRRARKYRAKAEEREMKEKGENVPTLAGLSIEA